MTRSKKRVLDFAEALKKAGACSEAVEHVRRRGSLEAAWRLAPECAWMTWLATHVGFETLPVKHNQGRKGCATSIARRLPWQAFLELALIEQLKREGLKG